MPSRVSFTKHVPLNLRLLSVCGLLLIFAGVITSVSSLKSLLNPVESDPAARVKVNDHSAESFALPQGSSVKTERIIVRPTGFDPSSITRRTGKFLLAVDNKSGLDELTLKITNEQGEQLLYLPLSIERSKIRQTVTLPAGEYSLHEIHHPDWICRIRIMP
jgi:hypothetical protein